MLGITREGEHLTVRVEGVADVGAPGTRFDGAQYRRKLAVVPLWD